MLIKGSSVKRYSILLSVFCSSLVAYGNEGRSFDVKELLAKVHSVRAKQGPQDKDAVQKISETYAVSFVEDLDYSKLKLIKSVFGRSARQVYFDQENEVYIKVWQVDYPLANFFVQALINKFYAGLAPLKSVLLDHSGNCRGYITYSIKQHYHGLSSEDGFIIRPLRYQNKAYAAFLMLLKRRVQEAKIVYFDLIVPNLAYDGKRYFLIDLESVFDIPACKREYKSLKRVLGYNPVEYERFVKALLKKMG